MEIDIVCMIIIRPIKRENVIFLSEHIEISQFSVGVVQIVSDEELSRLRSKGPVERIEPSALQSPNPDKSLDCTKVEYTTPNAWYNKPSRTWY